MSFNSIISNISSSVNKYGKSIKGTVNRMSFPKIKMLQPLFTSRLFLYFLVFVTIVVLFTYVNTRDITSVVALILIGFLASFFTKNMTIVLSVALIFTWVLKYIMKLRYEGFEGQEEEEEKKDKKENMETKENEEKKEEKKEDNENMSSLASSDVEKEKDLKELKKDYKSFEEIQKNILGGVKKINSELDKAETFIDKFESYKNKHGTKHAK